MKHIPITAVIASSAIAVTDAFSVALPRTPLHLPFTSRSLQAASNLDPIISSLSAPKSELKSFHSSQKGLGQQRAPLAQSRYGGRAIRGDIITPRAQEHGQNSAILGFDLGLNMVARSIDSSDWAAHESSFDDGSGRSSTRRNIASGSSVVADHHVTTSPIKKQIASNLQALSYSQTSFQNHGSLNFFEGPEGFRETSEVRNVQSSGKSASSVPGWFPSTPTRRQIESLKVVELRDACYERGLPKSGRKTQLQQRLLDWTNGQHRRRVLERNTLHVSNGESPFQDAINEALYSDITADPLRQNEIISEGINPEIKDTDIDYVEPLINHRKALLRSKKFSFSKTKGKLGFDAGLDDSEEEDDDMIRDDLPPTKDYIMDLQKTFAKQMDASPNNYKVKQLYQHAKYADQAGDSESAKAYLLQLRQVAPQDTRVIRRLARLEMQEGKVHIAREILQSGLRSMPKNGDMLQGLGQLELKCGNTQKARRYFRDAIVAAPKFPNPYHALATLEHSEGNIRIATTILRTGLKHCPTNHRLHHALGDLYREAKMLDMAEKAYLKGLNCIEAEAEETGKSLNWGKSFLYSALSYISYDKGDITECREWLRKSVDMSNNRMHSQGWLGLAELEESEGNLDGARDIYNEALGIYERSRGIPRAGTVLKRRVKPAQLGDKWINVYKSWTEFEEKYGSYDDANNVYSRDASAFPKDWEVLVRWAKFQCKYERHDRAKNLFELACGSAGSRDARPYRQYAEFEMAAGNYRRARTILFHGAQSLSESSNGSKQDDEIARLYHTWAIVEWHLENPDRAEILFDHSLRQIDSGIDGSEQRAVVLYSIARFLFHARDDCNLAQHCICLSLTENLTPAGDTGIWTLWAKVADAMSNEVLKSECLNQAEELKKGENSNQEFDVNTLAMHHMLRRAPWQHKIATRSKSKNDSWYKGISFPSTLATPSHKL